MNSKEQSITKTNTEEKVKNPKRVEQGKKLAEISKAAKARKLAKQQNEDESNFLQLPNLTTSISLISAATGVVGAYIAWKHFKQEEVNSATPLSPSKPKPSPKPAPNPTEVIYNNLDEDDI